MLMSSPFTSKFGTNYAAEGPEVEQIQLLLAEPTTKLHALEAEITQYKQKIRALKLERAELITFINGHKALLSPIRRMPRDVMEEIFLACLPTLRNSAMSAKDAPLLLGRVCSSWRTISLSTPRLWAGIHISQPSMIVDILPPEDRTRIWCEQALVTLRDAVLQWLSRSGECPLSISVQSSVYPVTTDVFGPNKAGILHMLLPFAPRWEHLEVSGCSPADLLSLPSFTPGDLQCLKSIDIDEGFLRSNDDDIPLWHTLSILGAENLTSAILSGNQFDPLLLPLPWGNLVHLTIHKNAAPPIPPFTMLTTKAILTRCNSLRTLRLWINTAANDMDAAAPLVHDSLELLELDCVGHVWTIARELCCHLRLPNLRAFIAKGQATLGEPVDDTYVNLQPFIEAAPLLEHVELFMDMFTKRSLRELLLALPASVRLLHLNRGGYITGTALVDNDILSLFSAPLDGSTSVACPGLEIFGIFHAGSFSDEDLAVFVGQRTENTNCRKLKDLAVRFERVRRVDIIPEIQSYIDDGLHVDLGYYQESQLSLLPFSGLRIELP
ncbi:hypothetical protein MIND_00799700 [Mycena indigotica]|uniref:F-box domain-containing protein n=1 Tax=Mycena indigotica TaxID=2126181 RepID=A0A8H6W0H3_9AGAR|nr:uncharacterized protein MIND_00799700 [Mycena indigotica]KAF7298531.1 hypothetical protein MIND_00799700 [Mycena indigotica]